MGDGAEVGREAIIEVARKVLRDTPPALITRQLLAKRAGIDPGLIRYYFGTIENLLAEVASMINRELRVQLDAATELKGPKDRLAERISGTLNMFLQNPHHHEIMLRHQLGPRSGEIKSEWRKQLKASLNDLKDIIAKGAMQGELRKIDERFLHITIIALLEFFSTSGPLLQDIFGEDANVADYREKYLTFVQELILEGVRPRAARK